MEGANSNKEQYNLLSDYLADILKSGEAHQKPFVFHTDKLSFENLSAGIVQITPQENSSSKNLGLPLILSCGIHGNETAPIEIVNDILKDLTNQKLSVSRPLLIIFGHLEGMREHKRFIDFNLNRLFCGIYKNHPDARESKRAQELEAIVASFFKKYGIGHHYDLHTAIRPSHLKRFAVYPTSNNARPSQEEIEALKSMGIEGLLVAGGKASTFSAHTHLNHQALGYTLELGKVEPFGKNNRQDFKEAEDYLRATISGKTTSPQDKTLKIYSVDHEMIRDSEDYVLHISEDYANFTPLEREQLIETTSTGTLKAKENQAVVFPNSKVFVGQRTGLLVSLVEKV